VHPRNGFRRKNGEESNGQKIGIFRFSLQRPVKREQFSAELAYVQTSRPGGVAHCTQHGVNGQRTFLDRAARWPGVGESWARGYKP